jgi:DNA repair ATPase RecN
VVNLFEPQLSSVSSSLRNFGVDPKILCNEKSCSQLHLSRTILRADASGRIKSLCRINGKHVSLKTLRAVSSPLFTRVDVATASAALSRSVSRLAMIDIAVTDVIKIQCAESKNEYERARKKRRQLERQLDERVLPVGMQKGGRSLTEEDMEMLRHWVDELGECLLAYNNYQGFSILV